MRNVILISGKQGSGKSTLTENLIVKLEDYGESVTYLKNAGIIYEMHDAINNVASKYGIRTETKDRVLLQWLGTEWGREIRGDNVWVDAVSNKIQQTTVGGFVIIDDVRFPNELSVGNNVNRFSIRLEASEEARRNRCPAWGNNTNHPSETALDNHLGSFNLVVNTDMIDQRETSEYVFNHLIEHFGIF